MTFALLLVLLLVLVGSGAALGAEQPASGMDILSGLTGAGGGAGVFALLLAWERLRGRSAAATDGERLARLETTMVDVQTRLTVLEQHEREGLKALAGLTAGMETLLKRQ